MDIIEAFVELEKQILVHSFAHGIEIYRIGTDGDLLFQPLGSTPDVWYIFLIEKITYEDKFQMHTQWYKYALPFHLPKDVQDGSVGDKILHAYADFRRRMKDPAIKSALEFDPDGGELSFNNEVIWVKTPKIIIKKKEPETSLTATGIVGAELNKQRQYIDEVFTRQNPFYKVMKDKE